MSHFFLVVVIALFVLPSVIALPYVQIDGIGASFPSPVIAAQLDYFHKSSFFTSRYEGGGVYSGLTDDVAPAITEFAKRSVYEFIASDIALQPSQIASLRSSNANKNILHFPHVLTGVVVGYNLPGYTGPALNFTADLLVGIYSKTVTNWNDAAILAINPALQSAVNAGLSLDGRAIIPGARSDPSSTTYEFTDYLSRFSNAGKWSGGAVKSVEKWITDFQTKDDGSPMAQFIVDTPYSIAYAKLKTAQGKGVSLGALRNLNQNFIYPPPEALAIAASSTALPAITSDQWHDISMGSKSGDARSYPATHFSYLIIYEYRADAGYDYSNITAAYDFIQFINTDTTVDTKLPKYFVPLPKELKEKNVVAIKEYLINPSLTSNAMTNNANMIMMAAILITAIFINRFMH